MLNPSLPVASRTRSRTEAHVLEDHRAFKRRKVVEEERKDKTSTSFASKKVTSEVHFLYQKSGVEIQQRKQDARSAADICSPYNDDDEEKYDYDDDSMEGSDEDLTSTSGEDNDESDDLDYCGKEEERGKEEEKKKNSRCSSVSDDDDDIVCLNDFTSSYTKPSKGRKGKAASEKLHLLTVLADTILNNEETENNLLPLNFTSGVEDTITSQDVEFEDGLVSLWTEMQFCLVSSEIGSTNPSLVETEDATNVSEVKRDRSSLCRQGDHELVLDEEIGRKCKFCSFLELEIKYITSPFMKRPCGKYERQHSGIVNSSVFDGLQDLDPSIDMPGDSSANIEGTVWEIVPNRESKLHPHQREGFEFMWSNIAGGIYRDKSKNSCSGGGGCIISHAPGTGKTLLTIVFLQTYLKEYPSSWPVIVAPCTMLLTWRDEFIKWKVDIPFHNLNSEDFSDKEETYAIPLYEKLNNGTPHADKHAKRVVKLLSWKSSGGVLGISYSLFTKLAGKRKGGKGKCKNLDDQISKILLDLPRLFVFDEGHIPRNADSLLWKSLSRIKTERRIILSGTPFQNNFKELFNTLWLVRPTFAEGIRYTNRYKVNTRRGRKGDQAKLKFAYWIGSIENDVDRNEKLREVRAVIKPFVHVYKGTILQTALPGLKHSLVVLWPTDLQKKILHRVEEILHRVEEILQRAREKNPFKKRRIKEKQNPLDLDRYVSLISIHPSLLKQLLIPLLDEKDSNEVVSSIVSMKELERIRLKPDEGVKTKFLMNLLKLSEALEEKVIVFSQYIGPLRLIMDQLQDNLKWKEGVEILFMHGQCDIKQRQCSINVFNDPKSKVRVLLASTKACSEGINLVGGSRLVLLDVTWNPSVERQAISRAYRLGQKKVVYIYHLISSWPMEASKYYRQAGKDRLSELLFSSDKGDHHKQVCNIVEDKVLEEMFRLETVKSMFEKIINEPKDSEFVAFEDQ
ncbi:putative Actin-binding LIM protein 1 [Hibiscus syriacus]|uniref:Actin-binding LIM protein 1 n=2 Tax=Hibiscus syriacus TaxID=106335 RepID=A0A6A2YGU8_HIBSY|nr:putative Actin-binding LIM protein 1 [Hibiscus syriacus]